jgi:hypothetical protein
MIKIAKWLFTTINGQAVLILIFVFLICALLENL